MNVFIFQVKFVIYEPLFKFKITFEKDFGEIFVK
jgi:hypothetical protein